MLRIPSPNTDRFAATDRLAKPFSMFGSDAAMTPNEVAILDSAVWINTQPRPIEVRTGTAHLLHVPSCMLTTHTPDGGEHPASKCSGSLSRMVSQAVLAPFVPRQLA